MFRRLETHGLPDQPSERRLFWDFRAVQTDAPPAEPGDPTPVVWHLSLQSWASGRWRVPGQAQWLASRNFRVPKPGGSVELSPDTLTRLTEALAPVALVTWAAMDARDEALRGLQQGHAAETLAAIEALHDLAPDWVDTKVLELEVLVRQIRDPDRAEHALAQLPDGTLDPAAARRIRQSIAILRDDWDAYAAELAAVLAAGERPWWNFEILGLAYWAGGRLDDAIATFAQGRQEHPGVTDLALRHVEVLAAADRQPEARAAVEALLQQPSPPAKAHALRGWLQRNTDSEAAAADYRVALEADPEQPVARVGRGLLRLGTGDTDGARSDLEPFRYCGWQSAWDAWLELCTTLGLEPGPHPSELGHDHNHDHDHDHATSAP